MINKFRLWGSIVFIAIFVFTVGNCFADNSPSTPALDKVDKAIAVVNSNNERFKKDKFENTEKLSDKIIKLIEKSRADAHKEVIGEDQTGQMFDDLVSTQKGETKKEKHSRRIESVKNLNSSISQQYKDLKGQISRDAAMSKESKKETSKVLEDLEEESKSALNKIRDIYADETEFDTVYSAVESIWSEFKTAKPDKDSVVKYRDSIRALSNSIITYSLWDNIKNFFTVAWVIISIIVLGLIILLVINLDKVLSALFDVVGLIFRRKY